MRFMRRFSQNQQEDKYNKDKLPLIFLEAWEQQILLVLFGRNQNPGLLLEGRETSGAAQRTLQYFAKQPFNGYNYNPPTSAEEEL